MSGKEYVLRFGGGSSSSGKTSVSGAAALLVRIDGDGEERPVFEAYECIKAPETAPRQAEYKALLLGLRGFNAGDYGLKLRIAGSSELVVDQMTGTSGGKNAELQRLHSLVNKEINDGGLWVEWLHVSREQNRRAEELANEAIVHRRDSFKLCDHVPKEAKSSGPEPASASNPSPPYSGPWYFKPKSADPERHAARLRAAILKQYRVVQQPATDDAASKPLVSVHWISDLDSGKELVDKNVRLMSRGHLGSVTTLSARPDSVAFCKMDGKLDTSFLWSIFVVRDKMRTCGDRLWDDALDKIEYDLHKAA
ncbi:hypothetical protein BC830DRAFT_1150327 [Chytriomyces sp. MP71]|nr:hypothetical protein BC830DRAFT_1150327 [Chytriomyces sp. MP71]